MSPKVSIIMPSLNVEPYIRECMDSVLRQTEQNIEIINIDAGSTDGTWEILQDYARSDKRVRLYRSEVRSYGAQVNRGISLARGKYVAILETDDYVMPEMYGTLYSLAEENLVDYIKADYDSFMTLSTGCKVEQRNKLLEKEPQLYNKVICPKEYYILSMCDYNLWKGIYNKSFLEEHGILLNESPGAAYQDIGFSELVLSYAQRAYYSDLSFYRYRLDREESSSNSVKGLLNAYREFKRLIETESLLMQIKNKKGLYLHMGTSFLGEYEKALRKVAYDYQSDEIVEAYTWFQEKLNRAMKNGLISKNDLTEEQFAQLTVLLCSPRDYAISLEAKDRKKQEIISRIVEKEQGQGIVIFGAGIRGNNVLQILDNKNVCVKAFADNNSNLIGRRKSGVNVYSLKECMRKYPSELYVIASKYNSEDMKRQFIAEGGREQQVIIFCP